MAIGPLTAQRLSDGGRPVPRTLRRIGVTVEAMIALYGLVGVIGVPLILRHVMTGPMAAALNLPVRVGGIRVHPYTLTAALDQLQIGERGTSQPFVEISRLRLRVSWASLVRAYRIWRHRPWPYGSRWVT